MTASRTCDAGDTPRARLNRSLETERVDSRREQLLLSSLRHHGSHGGEDVRRKQSATILFCGESVVRRCALSTNLVATVHGNGDRTFGTRRSVPVPNLPVTLAYGDFDRDGKLDVVVNDRSASISAGYRHRVFLFAGAVLPGRGHLLQPIDINGDGALDVVGITPIGFERLMNTNKD